MKEKSIYLSERNYLEIKETVNVQKYTYWKKLLGQNIVELLLHNYRNFNCYLKDEPYKSSTTRTDDFIKFIENYREDEAYSAQDDVKNNLFFTGFYKGIIGYGYHLLRSKIQEDKISQSVFIDFEEQLVMRLQDISIRTLIVEMHDHDSAGHLEGENAREKYEHFCKEIVAKGDFVRRIFEHYPVLCRCIEEVVQNTAEFYTDIMNWFRTDKQAIQQRLCNGRSVDHIQGIKGGFSDVHNKGKYVVRVLLDNGMEILCKPRSMETEKKYSEMLQWLSKETQIDQYEYAILSYSDHSWCAIVEYASCDSKEELECYYERLGVQLFLTYLLGTKDMHCENIVASGEYPVLIDLETLTNIRYNQNRTTADEEICYQLSQSVMYTGMLPFYHWNRDGRGVDSSMISGIEGQRYPFKVPVVVQGGTSDMRIEYRHPESSRNQNLATIKGEFQEPLLYAGNLKSGFRSAYCAVMRKKEEFCNILRNLEGLSGRYLIADTQRYSMILSSSYHPSLLRDGAEREIFLYSMWKGRKEHEKEIVDSEISSLRDGDIPYFYYAMNSKDLRDGRGRTVREYFTCRPIELLYQKLKRLSGADMEKQCEYIDLAMELMPGKSDRYLNRIYRSEKEYFLKLNVDRKRDLTILEKNITKLTERLLQYAVWNQEHSEVSWYTVQLSDDNRNNWTIRPMNVYLYDGLSGMLVLMYCLVKYSNRQGIADMYDTLRRRLFRYTDAGISSPDKLQSRNTGAYEGEGSILYAYLLLYQAGKEEIYLEYAKKHARIVSQLIEEDTRYDLLTGNAGAAHVLLMLYEIAPDEEYLDMAERAMSVLERAAKKQQKGIGWVTEKGTAPMAGAAHGNSGILMPMIHLWALTSNDKYEQLAEKAWEYEESLYCREINNWIDVREGEQRADEIGPAAWCHGAPGILYSRMECYKYTDNPKWKMRIETDMQRAYRKLKECWRRDSWCLCHGICGNLWIMEKASEVLGEGDIMYHRYFQREEVRLLPQEKVNPGLLNGYGGVLLCLINAD